MKILEIRRHSIRSPLSDHLNQSGVTLARVVGRNIGPFARVVTSTLPRAFETAVAMGFAVDEQNELMNSYGSSLEREIPWPQPFDIYSEFMKRENAAAKYAQKLEKVYHNVMDSIAGDQSALVINHGGVVELGVVTCLPDVDFSTWGGPVNYCEGARLFWDDGRFVKGEVLRVDQSSSR